jgi:hypothetical protein
MVIMGQYGSTTQLLDLEDTVLSKLPESDEASDDMKVSYIVSGANLKPESLPSTV